MTRQIIYIKDAMILIGKSEKSCREIFKKVKTQCGKNSKDSLTFKEFCAYMKINFEDIKDDIK